MSESPIRTIDSFRPGDHAGWLYGSQDEYRKLLPRFLRQGLEQGEKVFCVSEPQAGDALVRALKDDGVETDSFLASGQLQFLNAYDVYLPGGTFSPEATIARWQQAIAQARTEGYEKIRATGDVLWSVRGLPGSERLGEYEARVNDLPELASCVALCQYDRRRFKPGTLLDAVATHPVLAIGTEVFDNPFYRAPGDFLREDRAAALLNSCLNDLASRRRLEEAFGVVRQECQQYLRQVQDLKRQVRGLEELNGLMMDREVRILELKQEVDRLLAELDRPKRYNL